MMITVLKLVLSSWQENCGKQQRTSLECTSQVIKTSAGPDLSLSLSRWEIFIKTYFALQFQNGIPLHMIMSGVQEAQSLSWLPNNGNQHMIVPNEPNFLPHL